MSFSVPTVNHAIEQEFGHDSTGDVIRHDTGILLSRFAAVASSFIYSACSIMASASIVAELRSEIAALKEEISELRAVLRSSEQNLEKKLSLQVEALAMRNSSNYTNGGRLLVEAQ